jgi:arylsulfatase A-like enzyme
VSAPQHVLWITCDHLRHDNIAAHGNDFMHTPTLDRLVREGVSFDHAICQSPVCMPSRASFMSGCYPTQTGVVTNGQDLDPDFPLTVARCFKAAGYQTAQIGKLHFQHHEDMDLEPGERHRHGFDVFWCDEEPGCYEGPYLRWLRSEGGQELAERFQIRRPAHPDRGLESRRPTVIDDSWRHSYSGWVAEQARRYFAEWGGNRGRNERHFLHLGFYAPHPPLNPTADMVEPYLGRAVPPPPRRAGEHADKPARMRWALENQALDESEIENYRRHFAAMVTGIDFAVADIMNTLESLGVADDTLIIFGSDHGDYCGDHGLVSKGPVWYDGVMRVPWVMRWPKGLGAGQRVGGITELVDILPTILGLSGQAVPRAMTGTDWSAQLKDGSFDGIGKEAALAVFPPGHLYLRTTDRAYARYAGEHGPEEVLFALDRDPDEFVNCAGDAAFASELDHLRQLALDRTLEASMPVNEKIWRF